MNSGTWEAIARRQAWYVIVLEQKLAEWPKERIDACPDVETLRYALTLAKRVDRHEQLMIRHLSKGVALLPMKGGSIDKKTPPKGATAGRDPLPAASGPEISKHSSP